MLRTLLCERQRRYRAVLFPTATTPYRSACCGDCTTESIVRTVRRRQGRGFGVISARSVRHSAPLVSEWSRHKPHRRVMPDLCGVLLLLFMSWRLVITQQQRVWLLDEGGLRYSLIGEPRTLFVPILYAFFLLPLRYIIRISSHSPGR